MLNKEGIIFISTLIFFAILLVTQFIGIGYLILNNIINKKSIK
jgi:hypothetical protein